MSKRRFANRCGAATVLLALLLATFAAFAAQPVPTIQSASEYDYPPFSVVTSDGSADGFSVELLRAVLKAMGREVTFKVGPWHEISNDLAKGRIDVLPLMARTVEREDRYDFTVPYLTMHGTIVVRKGDHRIHDAADLAGKEVIVMKGDIGEEYVRTHNLTHSIFTTDTIEAALRQLAAGQHDAVIVQKLVGETVIKSAGLEGLEAVGTPLGDYQQFCFAVRDNERELLATLNEGLAIVSAEGTYAKLRAKWLAPVEAPRPLPLLPFAAAVLATLLLAWTVAYLWHGALREKVAARTAELSEANITLAHEIKEHQLTEQALRRTSEELEAIFANVHTHIAVLDNEFNFVRVNAAYARASNRSPESFFGLNHFALFPHPENERIFRNVISTGVPVSVTAKPFTYPDQPERGTTYWDWTISPLKGMNGRVEGLLFVLIDVTQQEQQRRAALESQRLAQAELERRVEERTAELQAANQELQSFSYSVSHDLRGPLRAINGFSSLLEEECSQHLEPEGRAYLGRIRDATLRMSSLIDGLLKLSQVFRSELQFTQVDMSALARDIAAQLCDSEPERSVTIEIAPNLHAFGDPTLLRVVLENLLNNAWKFTGRSSAPSILFGSEVRDGKTTFFVRDNGIGFDMAFGHKLFQPFERLHGNDTFAGTGIGLATVRRVIQRHGGEVWAESAPNQGANFYFTIGTCESQAAA